MSLFAKIVVGSSCVTAFAGSAYFAAITLAPPPTYTVSNNDRLRSYEKLSINNDYEKKTKCQEFYLGLSRWRRKMLREEGLLQGRVLEVGAGCGGNVVYYPTEYFSDQPEVHKLLSNFLSHFNAESGNTNGDNSSMHLSDLNDPDLAGRVSFLRQHIPKTCPCDEIILCDRAAGMVESCSNKIRARLGYTPYRYPDYDLEQITHMIEKSSDTKKDTAVRVKKVIEGDGAVHNVVSSPLVEADGSFVLGGEKEDCVIAPIIQELLPGNQMRLLSPEGQKELSLRALYIQARERFRREFIGALHNEETEIMRRREERGAVNANPSPFEAEAEAKRKKVVKEAKISQSPLSPPSQLLDASGKDVSPQPLFSVANYAAEQLPFSDNSFDTVVDMFGLCSYDDPVRALRELSRVCKPGGKLLLIEHGKGHTPRVNSHLDKWAPRHAKTWGCWWNRDIRRIIRLSGLTVEKWESRHFGTSHYIVARPFKSMGEWDAFEK
ncbi:hypothetical protein AGDE_01119 [Angomonas deanei]|nr:hypothetical protein AGDE_01119 [Angomonas deanei]|eukprot:EPY42804.1 hypothetical protein AGDE_01119 [Angomonas deanei]